MNETTPNPVEPAVINDSETPVVPSPEADKVKQLEQEVAQFKFKEEIGKISTTYPHARDFADDIQKLTNEKGYSVEDATLVVLNKNGKLVTAEQIARQSAGGPIGTGGSMDNLPGKAQKEPKPGEPGAAEYWANKVKELEAKGEIRVS